MKTGTQIAIGVVPSAEYASFRLLRLESLFGLAIIIPFLYIDFLYLYILDHTVLLVFSSHITYIRTRSLFFLFVKLIRYFMLSSNLIQRKFFRSFILSRLFL